MVRVTAGIVCCLAGIALVHQNRWVPGLLLFIAGLSLMMFRNRL